MSAAEDDIGFLVVGDPLCATTHTDLILRCSNLNSCIYDAASYYVGTDFSDLDPCGCHHHTVRQIIH